MKKLIGLGLGILLITCMAGQALADTAESGNISILVYPGISVSLKRVPTFYKFGQVNVNASSHSTSGIALNNTGTVDVSLEKQVTAASGTGWTLVTDAPDTQDEFRLWCIGGTATQTKEEEYEAVASTMGGGVYSTLKNASNARVDLTSPGGGTTTWYQIDMPPTASNTAERKFIVKFRATSKD